MQVVRKDRRPSNVHSAINALADRLSLPPQDLSEWLREPHGVPPEVLLSWICRHCSASGAVTVKKRTSDRAQSGAARGRARTAR